MGSVYEPHYRLGENILLKLLNIGAGMLMTTEDIIEIELLYL